VSGIFEEGSAAQQPPAAPRRTPSRRPRALIPTLGVVVLLVVLFSVFVEVWTGRMWFNALGFGEVFTTVLWTRVGLFVVFGLILAVVTVGNVVLAFRMRPILLGDGYRNPTVERYQDTVDPIRNWIVGGLGALMFLFGGASAAGHWKTYLLWRNGDAFGEKDVYFGKDIGFFVFGYPWYRFLITFGFTVLIIALLASIATHYLYGAIRLQARRDKIASGAQIHLSVLLGLFMLVKAVSYWLDRYGLAMHGGDLITGITYTDANAVLPSKNILTIIALICAVLFFANVVRPSWMLPVLGLGLLVLSSILIGGIWPAIVQRFQVQPSEPDKEAPYITKNIEATRDAFNISGVQLENYPGVTTDTPQELQKKAAELPGVRLIDPRRVSDTFEQLQQIRGFYQMAPILDVDRYKFGDDTSPEDVVIGVRELNLSGVPEDQRNWANDHTVYTHGYGVVAAYGTQRSPNGEPVWAQRNLPSTGQLGEFQQEVYYGEAAGTYSIVGAPKGRNPVELNIPETGNDDTQAQNSTYSGKGGVDIGSTFNQMLYAAKFWDSSILLSGRVNEDSKIIYDRNPRQMVQKVAPWLTVDGDAYPAVVDKRLVWIIDGYTSTSDYPMSNLLDLSDAVSDSRTPESDVAGAQTDDINYIRNSVKATVDAYDGTVTLYQWDTEDPLLKAWMKAFPDSVVPKDQVSDDLLAHLRYPEDLFKVQREVLARYHVTDTATFYRGSENWEVPEDPTQENLDRNQPPFYLTVQMPESAPEFSLTSVYTPRNRQNMASFMAVNADATSDEYGQFKILELPSDTAVQGPGQVANALQNDPTVAQAILSYKNTSKVEYGNLLTLPLGDEVVYVQPVYTYSGGTGSYPILQFVLVSVGGADGDSADQVGIGTSFDEAVANALGLAEAEVVPPGETPSGGNEGGNDGGGGVPNETPQQQVARLLAEAQADFEAAQKALDEGDLGTYQEMNQAGVDKVQQAADLQDQINAGTAGGDGTSDGSGN
jgi:uncharacterized membrane protein (UPF0182 family)